MLPANSEAVVPRWTIGGHDALFRIPAAKVSPTGDFNGTHLFGELYGVSAALLDDEPLLRDLFVCGVPKGGATLCSLQSKRFEPMGVTVLALLAESHASVHTYPERGCLFLDIFTCGACSPRAVYDFIVERLRPERAHVTEISRGENQT